MLVTHSVGRVMDLPDFVCVFQAGGNNWWVEATGVKLLLVPGGGGSGVVLQVCVRVRSGMVET